MIVDGKYENGTLNSVEYVNPIGPTQSGGFLNGIIGPTQSGGNLAGNNATSLSAQDKLEKALNIINSFGSKPSNNKIVNDSVEIVKNTASDVVNTASDVISGMGSFSKYIPYIIGGFGVILVFKIFKK